MAVNLTNLISCLKVCSYVRERSSEFQCIVISLKDTFFSTADSLVGTCRDLGT